MLIVGDEASSYGSRYENNALLCLLFPSKDSVCLRLKIIIATLMTSRGSLQPSYTEHRISLASY